MKWASAVLAAILLLAWLASGWCKCGWQDDRGRFVTLHAAQLNIGRMYPGMHALPWPARSFTASLNPWTIRWNLLPRWSAPPRSRVDWLFECPLAGPFAATLLITAVAWRYDAIAKCQCRIGGCVKCGYDRVGLAPDANCPECGAAV